MPPHLPDDPTASPLAGIRALLFDLDGTVTRKGRLPAASLAALEALQGCGVLTIAVTGRPAGWCDLIARWWPVDAVVGENGALTLMLGPDGSMLRDDVAAASPDDRARLEGLMQSACDAVPGSAPAQDNDWRCCDVALDFAEAVPALPLAAAERAAAVFREGGATAKISSIHVNAWFGDHNKRSTSVRLLEKAFGLSPADQRDQVVFVGDSPNDEPMFAHFPISVGVAGLTRFADQVSHWPAWLTQADEADGFLELVAAVRAAKGVA